MLFSLFFFSFFLVAFSASYRGKNVFGVADWNASVFSSARKTSLLWSATASRYPPNKY